MEEFDIEIKIGSEFGSDGVTSDTESSCLTAEIDQQMRHYEKDNIVKLIITNVPQFCASNLLSALMELFKFTFVARNGTFSDLTLLMLLIPFESILCYKLPRSIGQVTSAYAIKNALQSQFVAATIYYVYFIVSCLLLYMVTIVVCFAYIRPTFTTPEADLYIIILFTVHPFGSILTYAQHFFWKSENRHGLISAQEAALFAVQIGVTMLLSSIGTVKHFDCLLYAEVARTTVALIWGWFVFFRKPFLGVKFRGVIRLALKRLSPFRPKLLVFIFIKSAPVMLYNAVDPALFMICLLIPFYDTSLTDYMLHTQLFRVQIIYIVKQLLEAIHRGVADVFDVVASYNISVKRFRRAFKTIIWCFVIDFIVGFIIGVCFASLASEILTSILPGQINGLIDIKYQIRQTKAAWVAESIASMCLFWQMAAGTLLIQEQHNWAAAIAQLPKLIYTVSMPFISKLITGKNAPFYMIVALGDVISAIVGVFLLVEYLVKFNRLSAFEKETAEDAKTAEKRAKTNELEEDIGQITAELRNIRQSMAKMREGQDPHSSSHGKQEITIAERAALARANREFAQLIQESRKSQASK